MNAIQNCIVEWRSIVSHHNDLNQIKQQENEARLLNISGQEDEEQQHRNKVALKRANSCGVDSNLLAVEWSKTTSVQLFQLVQMAMQVGPLSGSKPGYFKRCGADVAELAYEFLITLMNGSYSKNTIDTNKEAMSASRQSKTSDWSISPTQIKDELRLTEKQIQVIQKWIMNAEKAAMGKNSPSKSVRKKQKQNEAKLLQKREIRQKKLDKKKK